MKLSHPRATMHAPTPREKFVISDRQWFYIFIAPSVIILLVVVFIPLVWAAYLSITDYSLIKHSFSPPQLIGLANFQRLLAPTSDFWEPFWNTLVYSFFSVATSLVIGLLAALALNQGIRGLHYLRTLVMVPWILPTVVTALLWLWILNPQYGILNFILMSLEVTDEPISWLTISKLAMPMMVLITTWKSLPYYTIMLLSGLQLVPVELMDAATIDGANPLQRLWYVILPTMRNIIMVVILMGTIWGFQQFTIMWTTTQGGPVRATETLALYIYREAFQAYDMGFAASAGLIALIFLAVFSLIFIRLVRSSD
jgi:multiple sugar transport system permease protein